MSAHTRKSHQGSIKKAGRGLGYFGDDNDKIKEAEQKQQMEQNFRVKPLNKKTNEEGKVAFDQLPIGQYHLEVKGTDFYLPTQKELTIVNEEEKNEIVIFVGVKPRIDTDIEFQFVKSTGDNTFANLDPQHVEAKAILLPLVRGSGD